MRKYYKAFEKGMICLEKQYQENTVYEEEGRTICEGGVMHFCETLFDTLEFYPLVDEHGNLSEFAEVEPLDEIIRAGNKRASRKIRVGSKLSFYEFVRISADDLIRMEKPRIGFLFKPALNDGGKDEARIHNSERKADVNSSGNKAKISNSGYEAFIGSSGYDAKIGNSGDCAQISSAGTFARIGNSGREVKISSLNDDAKISNYGDFVKINSLGDNVAICNSGDNVWISTAGGSVDIANIGTDARINNSANNVKICNYGEDAHIENSGDEVVIKSFGDGAQISSTGEYARIKMEGHESVAVAIGYHSAIRGKVGDFITLGEHADFSLVPTCIKTAQIDGEILKEDVFYVLENGEFVEDED